jgi:hypothetical protein
MLDNSSTLSKCGFALQTFEPHVINDDQIRLEVFAQHFLLLVEGFVGDEL